MQCYVRLLSNINGTFFETSQKVLESNPLCRRHLPTCSEPVLNLNPPCSLLKLSSSSTVMLLMGEADVEDIILSLLALCSFIWLKIV